MKKFVKYIFYAVVVLLGLYILFWSRAEYFTSPNPILTQADLDFVNAWLSEPDLTKRPEISKTIQFVINWLNTSNVANLALPNVAPVSIPSTIAAFKAASIDAKSIVDWMIMPSIKDNFNEFLSIQDYVKSSTEPPSYSDFYNKVQQIVVQPGNMLYHMVALDKNPTPTVSSSDNTVYINVVYFLYKYYYGVEPTTKPSQKSKPKPPPKPCHASYSPISGGTVETRCFTK